VKYRALAALVVLAACSAAALAQNADDEPPAFSPHHCGFPRVQWIYFSAGADTTSDAAMMERLSETARFWAANGGYILLRGHYDAAERTQPGQPDVQLDVRRTSFVRGELVARGIPGEAVWVSPVGDAAIEVPWEPSNPTAGKRRVDLITTSLDDQCRRSVREALAAWSLRNCLPDQARDDLRRRRCEGVTRDLAR
jgi:hypothetical protein